MDDLAHSDSEIEDEYEDGDDDAHLANDPLPSALSQYTIDELAAMEIDDSGDPLYPIRIMAAEYVARQFINRFCPNWMPALIDAVVSCIDLAKPVRVGSLPGNGATKARDVAYEHHAVGESGSLWLTKQAAAAPILAGISPVVFIAGQLVPRIRTAIRRPPDDPLDILVCTARRDEGLSGQYAQIAQLFVPRDCPWAQGALRVSTLTRHAFATSLQELNGEIQSMLNAAPSWEISVLIAEDLERMIKTTGSRRGPSAADKSATFIGLRAIRNLVGSNPSLAARLIELEYVYRHYEVLR